MLRSDSGSMGAEVERKFYCHFRGNQPLLVREYQARACASARG